MAFREKSKALVLSSWSVVSTGEMVSAFRVLSDGWDRLGTLHWQIHKDGFVELAVWKSIANRTNNSRASFVMQPSDFGRFVILMAGWMRC
jgi:hypothetical protein